MSLADRFRARLLRRRPKELEGRRPLLALPAPPHRRRQAPPAEVPLCPRCGTRHPPVARPPQPHWAQTSVDPDLHRPTPLGRSVPEGPGRGGLAPWRQRIG